MLAPDVPNMDLADALRLTLLARSKDPEAFEPMALRWTERFITEAEAPLPEVSLAIALLADVKAGRRATDDVEKELLRMAVKPQISVV